MSFKFDVPVAVMVRVEQLVAAANRTADASENAVKLAQQQVSAAERLADAAEKIAFHLENLSKKV